MSDLYFAGFESRTPNPSIPLTPKRERIWHFLAAFSLGLGGWYCYWRWTETLNPDALFFSIAVAMSETLALIGCALFYHDIWRQNDTPKAPAPQTRQEAGLTRHGPILVDILITTLDETSDILELSIQDALNVSAPKGVVGKVYILDDGSRENIKQLAARYDVGYISRPISAGFKAGNLRHALLRTSGDFFVICDADTRLFKGFLQNTLGYFRAPKTAWVQTPHWFYDIPEPQQHRHVSRTWIERIFAKILSPEKAHDPFMCDPGLFFDVIQRRRHRNNASFCCGAASIHRKEAVLSVALKNYGAKILTSQANQNETPHTRIAMAATDLQPFKYHVSEDIFTSIMIQSDPGSDWQSVYHPDVESRMLSPWGMKAWTTQRFKYAGGSLDICFRERVLLNKHLPWRTKLHYLATFWSYLSCLWLLILLMAPVLTLLTGKAPISAPLMDFVLHLGPFLLINELALVVGCWGHDINKGRQLAIAGLPLTLKALWAVIKGQKIKFKATPKTPFFPDFLASVRPHIVLMSITLFALVFAVVSFLIGANSLSLSFLIINFFWAMWNIYALSGAPRAALWRSPISNTGNE
ncbi:MAG: glycosyltransferase [Pseudoruegeria sp.]